MELSRPLFEYRSDSSCNDIGMLKGFMFTDRYVSLLPEIKSGTCCIRDVVNGGGATDIEVYGVELW